MNRLRALSELFGFELSSKVAWSCIDTGFSCRDAGYPLVQAYDDPEKGLALRLLAEERYHMLPLPQIIRHTLLGAHDFGGDVRLPSGPYDQAMKVVSHPVQDESQAWELQLPDPKTAGGINTAMRFSKLQYRLGLPVWFHHRSPFTMAVNICGMERFGRWMHRKPDVCRHLIRMATQHVFNVLDDWVNTFGTAAIAVYNSSPMESNQMISPLHFQQLALPAHIDYIERLNQLGIKRYFFHICGDQLRNMPHLAGIARWHHPAIISIGHEIPLDRAAAFFPHDVIYGNIDPRILYSGSPDEVAKTCHEVLEKGTHITAGHILAPGCDMPLSTPSENIDAIVRTVANYHA